jgi:hypothetical protein
VSSRLGLLRLIRLVGVAGVFAAAGSSALAGGDISAAVLSEQDVGPGYTLNRQFSTKRTLAEVGTAAPAAIKHERARSWLECRAASTAMPP